MFDWQKAGSHATVDNRIELITLSFFMNIIIVSIVKLLTLLLHCYHGYYEYCSRNLVDIIIIIIHAEVVVISKSTFMPTACTVFTIKSAADIF